MPEAAAQNTPAVDPGKDVFALGGRQETDLSAFISALWERHRGIDAEMDRLGRSIAPQANEESNRLARLAFEIEREICGRVTASIPELIIQVIVLHDFVEPGSMRDDIDLLLAANIVTGLQRLNMN